MKFLKREIKTTVGSKLIQSVIYAVILAIIVCICLNSINEPIQTVLKSIATDEISALYITIILLLIFIIVLLTIKMSMLAIRLNDKK